MLFQSRPPAPMLAPFVEHFWHLSDAPAHERERVLPTGTLELVINLVDDVIEVHDPRTPTVIERHAGAVVSGTFDRSFGIDTRAHASMIGVHFRPGGACPFIAGPVDELASLHVELTALWGDAAVELRDRLRAATTVSDRFRILELALVTRLAKAKARHRIVPYALARLARDGARVADLAQRAGVSHRRLIEVFRAEVGMTPKRFARIKRFERAVALLGYAPPGEGSDLAVRCGYFDQSHMIGDFVSIAGLTPGALVRQTSERLKAGHLLG